MTAEDELLLREAEKIATAVGRMFPGLCEVVLHDLRDPTEAVRVIENNLSGRAVGEPATEIGLARIQDPDYPDIIQNYPNRFPDGRAAKSTSIGIKNSDGVYVAAICLNLDVSLLEGLVTGIGRLIATDEHAQPLTETLRARTIDELRSVAQDFAAVRGRSPATLGTGEKRELARTLETQGFLQVKHSVGTLAGILGVSRATVYNYLRQ
ncbi:helix-turn-helix transcriptional regulator [Streptomyces albipurpureus]|uniref:PAS domain-containing protein n=1 Tax=Streptomyces albipurpureus TaxID=2897419 RepID=A0ABT0UHK8_9ACTN|nr:PAS domain-containing protein [Streptomyces sp. CWNU-1]MCM2387707.1 PAS domain-containing protein [Streptomyces sp. CWNU-1]